MTPAPPQQQAKPRTPRASAAVAPAQRPGENNVPVMEARSTSTVVHRVKPGETLWSIARAYQTTVEAIQAGNRYLVQPPAPGGRYADHSCRTR